MSKGVSSYPLSINTRIVYTPVILYNDKMFRYVDFGNEEDMKHILLRFKKLLKKIFGGNTVYMPVERLMEGDGVKGVPDAFLLIFGKNKLDIWIVEFELIRHGVKSHIKPQIERFNKVIETLDLDKMANKIYSELNRLRKVRYMKKVIFGEDMMHIDFIPKIKESLLNSYRNILIILNRVNNDLIDLIADAKKNGKYNFEVMIMQLYSNGAEDMLLITPFSGSLAAEKPIEYTVISKRRMDRYWFSLFKLMNSHGLKYKRRHRRKRSYVVFYNGEKPVLVMWKSSKRGIVNIRIDYSIVHDYLIKLHNIPQPKKCKSFCKMFPEEYRWDSYIELNSSLFSFEELKVFLDKILRKSVE